MSRVICNVNGRAVNALIDSGSDSTFLSTSIAEKLKLKRTPLSKTVGLADLKQKAQIIGKVFVNIDLNGHSYPEFSVEIIENLFIDMIIGKDLMKKHSKVTFNFKG